MQGAGRNLEYIGKVKMPESEGWLWLFRAGIGFILLAGLLFLLGFATDHWVDDGTQHYGLWEVCSGSVCTQIDSPEAYHVATQAFQTMACAAYGLAPIIHFFFYCSKSEKNKGCKTRIFDVGYSIGLTFHLISILIFGLEYPNTNHLSWAFKMSASALAIGFLGILMVIVSRNRALHNFSFFTGKQKRRRSGKVGILNTSNSSTSSRTATPSELSTRRSNNVFGPQSRHPPVFKVDVHLHPSPGQPSSHFGTSAAAVPYPFSYGQSQQGPSYPPPVPHSYSMDPAYPPSQSYSFPAEQPTSSGLAPLRRSVQPSAPPPPYAEPASGGQSNEQYEPGKSSNW